MVFLVHDLHAHIHLSVARAWSDACLVVISRQKLPGSCDAGCAPGLRCNPVHQSPSSSEGPVAILPPRFRAHHVMTSLNLPNRGSTWMRMISWSWHMPHVSTGSGGWSMHPRPPSGWHPPPAYRISYAIHHGHPPPAYRISYAIHLLDGPGGEPSTNPASGQAHREIKFQQGDHPGQDSARAWRVLGCRSARPTSCPYHSTVARAGQRPSTGKITGSRWKIHHPGRDDLAIAWLAGACYSDAMPVIRTTHG